MPEINNNTATLFPYDLIDEAWEQLEKEGFITSDSFKNGLVKIVKNTRK
jgi:hypothetical protein